MLKPVLTADVEGNSSMRLLQRPQSSERVCKGQGVGYQEPEVVSFLAHPCCLAVPEFKQDWEGLETEQFAVGISVHSSDFPPLLSTWEKSESKQGEQGTVLALPSFPRDPKGVFEHLLSV